MPKLILTVGIPASGKSTWAREWVSEDFANRVRVNRDDTRTFLNVKHGQAEQLVSASQQGIVRAALANGKDVVVDDTNLVPRFAKEWLKIAQDNGANVEWHEEFLKVDVRVCIDRDRNRDAKVGTDVIMKMAERAKQWKRPTLSEAPNFSHVQRYEGTPGKPPTILVDIDGTLALNGESRDKPNRGWFDWDRVGEDLPNWPVLDTVGALHDSHFAILFVSGRTDEGDCRELTEEWLAKYFSFPIKLIMRETNCGRKDSIVKLELFDKYIRHNYDVQFCIDDRNQVVRAYRDVLGLTVFQVNDGDF